MGGNGSTTRKVSFGLDEDEKVTVIEGVKLSEDVLRRMRDSQKSDSTKTPSDSRKSPPSPKPTRPSSTEIQEEMRKNFERQQALVQEELSRLAQRERDAASATGLDELAPALIAERGKAHEEQERAKILAKQLERKEKELASISSFYKEQLETLEKKNFDNYKETAEQYNKAATQAEAHIRPRQTASLCTELQAKVLQCYRENPQQTLQCSSLARQYMTCVQQAKKGALTNHG
ncbi:coiled-coil-helix-coiled-coil-helix domain containing 6b [Stegastes partitus]|uniref:Coiled-coil-helix-coiled-coil-helix domain containing 6 n=2 Tax=Stegastes partitus TaxID=144197 RepID=A0A3B5B5X0_9TELE|nr:PREDICTED: coiled-coil-helix-coiled-coil-helix domain-containing protein 6, mitochondrial [Stegastes partitus]